MDYDPNWQSYNVGIETRKVSDHLNALGGNSAAFIGTSHSGLIIHVLAAMPLSLIKTVVLSDIDRVIETADLAHIRSYLENTLRSANLVDAVRIQEALYVAVAAFPVLSDADWQRFVHAIYYDDAGNPVADHDPTLINKLAMSLSGH